MTDAWVGRNFSAPCSTAACDCKAVHFGNLPADPCNKTIRKPSNMDVYGYKWILSIYIYTHIYTYIPHETSIWNHPDEIELKSSLHSLEGAKEQATQATLSSFGFSKCWSDSFWLKNMSAKLASQWDRAFGHVQKICPWKNEATILQTVFVAESNPHKK